MLAGILFGGICNFLQLATSSFTNLIETFLFFGLFDVLGKIFIASLKLLVVPLVFISLTCGVAGLGGKSNLGTMSLKTIGLYLMTTALAITLALSVSIFVKPGEDASLSLDGDQYEEYQVNESPSFVDIIVNIFPSNPIEAMAQGNMLQIIVIAVLLGVAISKTKEEGKRVMSILEAMNELMMQILFLLMRLAPYGIFCLLALNFYVEGFNLLLQLFSYFATVISVLIIHCFLIYSLLLVLFTGLNPITFMSHLRHVWIFGFATASSNATIPITLETLHKMGIKKSIASFTVPLGATLNMDGTAIMQGVATVFIAQVYQIDLSIIDYLTVVMMATLASIGTAGVPGVGLITLAMVLQQVGLPVEGIALIIGVDRLLDMLRTSVNLTGDTLVSCIIANNNGDIDHNRFVKKI